MSSVISVSPHHGNNSGNRNLLIDIFSLKSHKVICYILLNQFNSQSGPDLKIPTFPFKPKLAFGERITLLMNEANDPIDKDDLIYD